MTNEKSAGVDAVTPLPLRQDFLGGLVIIAVAATAIWLGFDLPLGTLGGMGSGMLPRALAVLLGALGALLVFDSLWEGGERLHRWTIRGPIFVFGSMVAFGLAVRPLGLVVAGPLAIILSAFADHEVQWQETVVSGALMTILCAGLFKYALGLPIPLAPWLLGY